MVLIVQNSMIALVKTSLFSQGVYYYIQYQLFLSFLIPSDWYNWVLY